MNAIGINRSSRLGAMHSGTPSSQRGAMLPLVAIGMLVFIAMTGLALDGGHMMLNKTRLQNTVDASALTAAKTLDATSDEGLARDAALLLFDANAAAHAQMWAEYDANGEYHADGVTVAVQFSSTLNPFLPGTAPAEYVRVRATGFTLPSWLLQVIGFNNKTIAATAVAGPSPTVTNLCNLAPLMMCGAPGSEPPLYGYAEGEPRVLKMAAGGSSAIGPGNFQLIQLGGSGGDVIRENLAGSFDQCFAATDTVTTQPGVLVGPVAQGLNTRFGEHTGVMTGTESIYPPDVVIEGPIPALTYDSDTDTITSGEDGPVVTNANDLTFNYADYQQRYVTHSYDIQPDPGYGRYERRIVSVPIGDCNGTTGGSGQVPVMGFGCFFFLQPVDHKGNEAYIYGQFIGSCNSGGVPGSAPGAGPGPYIIQLYKDPDATAS